MERNNFYSMTICGSVMDAIARIRYEDRIDDDEPATLSNPSLRKKSMDEPLASSSIL
ncbi:hypothetical protein KIN20_036798 [Parelaphostrongylus tenuis]|uniref:Uncharacterized protein n=1 Tax=Parelaphostrongylus tenuis TaxID=148309 RepID=A0AAD5RD26_PARTN|nr:hypothetical protein KIN20_036798 [Parelaphostrongylus tenuis]